MTSVDEIDDECGILLMAGRDVISNNDAVWYLDTAVSTHICGNKHMFLN